MKKGLLFLVPTMVVFAVLVLCPMSALAQPASSGTAINLKIASARPNTDVQLKSIEWWASEVEKRTNGAITFSFFWSGSLIKATEELEAVRNGLAQLSPVTIGEYPSKLPLANLFAAFPFGPDQPITVKIVDQLYNEFPALRKEIEQYNQKILYFLPTPSYDIGSLVPLRTVDDFKGKKVIVIGKNMSSWISAIGGAAVAVPAPERYMALKTGVAHGEVFPTTSIYDFRHGEVVKYITEVGMGAPITWYFAINRDVWNKLSPDTQRIMEATATEAVQVLLGNSSRAKDNSKTALKAAGVTFYAMSAAEKQKWANMMPDLPAQWANEAKAQGYPGWEVLNRFISLSKAAGHTFPREWGQQK
jgi:TRAP-type C4-dicarboxylate transport system substrate-binding protein